MLLQDTRTVLLNAAPVAAIVGDRVSYVTRGQTLATPSVLLSHVATTPQNHINGPATLDANRVQVDVFAASYTEARQLAAEVRSALEAAAYIFEGEFDNFEPDVTEFRVTQDFSVWT